VAGRPSPAQVAYWRVLNGICIREVGLLVPLIKIQLTIDHSATKEKYGHTHSLKEHECKPQKPYNPSHIAVKRYYA